MKLSINQKQYLIYYSLVILTIMASLVIYPFTQQKWLIFREAENKFQDQSFEEAIALYQESLAKGPTSAIAFLHLADSYVTLGNFSEGVKYYKIYLEAYPHDVAVRVLLARALSWSGHIKEAEQEYQKVLEYSREKNTNF